MSEPRREWALARQRESQEFRETYLALVRLLLSGRAPAGLRVLGSLPLSHLRLRSLPADLRVDGDLDLRQCERLRRIGRGLEVAGDLLIGGGAALPRWLQLLAGSDLVLQLCRDHFTPLESLPEGLRVGRALVLENCRQLLELPQALAVAGSLELRRCGLRRLPPGLRVGGDLIIDDCPWLDDLGEHLALGGTLHFTRCPRLRGAGGAPSENARCSPAAPARGCYICGERYHEATARYWSLCPACARLNEEHRADSVDLTGRIALVTGGRVKIGHETALRLLRNGATVLVTTRFAIDAEHRFRAVPDHPDWGHRLRVLELDLRSTEAVLALVEKLRAELPGLDILVNNAAQTVRDRGEDETAIVEPNSWALRLHEVPPDELLEVLLVNTVAPFHLLAGLRPLLERSSHPDRYAVNVCGADGQFNRRRKGSEHPHVSLSKAALNMLTRTTAEDFVRLGIHVCSVDPGWVSLEGPAERHARQTGFVPPLDAADGASRVCHPIIEGVRGHPIHGRLLRHFEVVDW